MPVSGHRCPAEDLPKSHVGPTNGEAVRTRERQLGALGPNLAQYVVVDVPHDCGCGADSPVLSEDNGLRARHTYQWGRDPGLFAGMFHGAVELGQVAFHCSGIKKEVPQRRVNVKVVSRWELARRLAKRSGCLVEYHGGRRM